MASSYVKTGTPGVYKRGETYSIASRNPITKRVEWINAGGNYSDAKALKRKLDDAKAQGRTLPNNQVLFPRVWEDGFVPEHLSHLAASTQADYASIFRRYLSPRWSRTPITNIDAAEILRFKAHLAKVKSARGVPLSDKRVRNILLVCQSFFGYAVSTNAVWSNPVAELGRGGKPSAKTEPRVFLTPQQGVELLDVISELNPSNPQPRVLFHFLLQTGARLGESLATTWAQVNLEKRVIVIDRSVYRGVAKSTKNGKSRTVGISGSLLTVLERHRETVPHEPESLVFPSKRDGFQDANGVRRYLFQPAKELCCERNPDFPRNAVVHSTRHSYASALVAAGASMLQVRDLLGHSSVAVSEIYAHADADTTVAASIEAMDSVV